MLPRAVCFGNAVQFKQINPNRHCQTSKCTVLYCVEQSPLYICSDICSHCLLKQLSLKNAGSSSVGDLCCAGLCTLINCLSSGCLALLSRLMFRVSSESQNEKYKSLPLQRLIGNITFSRRNEPHSLFCVFPKEIARLSEGKFYLFRDQGPTSPCA